MKRNTEKAIRDVIGILERQLAQGIENAARHIVACLGEIGMPPDDTQADRNHAEAAAPISATDAEHETLALVLAGAVREPCPSCDGTGFVYGSCCRRCEGSMSIEKEGDE